jgi:hypothetical protein
MFVSIVVYADKYYKQTDNDGVWEVRELDNNIKIRQLISPSTTYITILEEKRKELEIKMEGENQKRIYEVLISTTMKQSVVDLLKSQGKLPQDYK